MRTYRSTIALLATMLWLAAGCSSNSAEQMEPNSTMPQTDQDQVQQEVETTTNITSDLMSGLEKVETSLKKLQSTVEKSSSDPMSLNMAGEQLDESWDVIEDKIEDHYPDDYKNIEESLYPLINEAKKDQPDTTKVKQLIDDTMKKITEFKEKVEKSAS
ncbi:iron uptake system EfeUOB component EfeO/EfeM [Oikeobacillus pervagus]|uniref:Iron uptake system EfeUOB component EfeO/EfeM n=1 Tax=Oikeobacillus pervagus TaxID=1325931 RepID=A0AAJ1T6K5_9BACI|nr:hypothetical protein [Oikeobacillus pervagus]MDQ0216111.1 iron uptake system EfeUOB component EfeO/EfeM [Oikeobacillus pervagus]